MRDVLAWRLKFGVLGPSTNTIVQPDFEMMRPMKAITAVLAGSSKLLGTA
jgi:maleate cis-trans isomerase